MARLFPRWSDTALRVGLALLFGGALAVVAAPMVYLRTPYGTKQGFPVDQPVQFDHRHHVLDDGIDCRYCHDTVDRAPSAAVPSTAVCMGCHAQIWSSAPLLEPLRRGYFAGAPIPWRRVHQLPDFVYFDHSIHVRQGVGCVSCHGRVDEMALVHQVAPLTMGWCLECHRAPERHLRPRDRITDMEWKPAGDAAAVGRRLAAEYGVRKVTHCSACHR